MKSPREYPNDMAETEATEHELGGDDGSATLKELKRERSIG
jgi:hypothetical protein